MPKPNDPNANEPNGNEPEGGTGTPEPTGGDGGKPEGNEPGALKDKLNNRRKYAPHSADMRKAPFGAWSPMG